MSTRNTIYYGECLHLYEETSSGEVCLQVMPIKLNEKYGTAVITKKDLVEIADSINEFIKDGGIGEQTE